MANKRLGIYDTKTRTWKKSAVHDVVDLLSGTKLLLEQAQREQESGSQLPIERIVDGIKKRREILLRELVPFRNELFFAIERDSRPGLLDKFRRTKKFWAFEAVNLLRQQLNEECALALSFALEKDPTDARLLLARGIRFAVGTPWDYARAISDFEAVVCDNEHDQLALLCLGVVHFALGDNRDARAYLTRAARGSLEAVNSACARVAAEIPQE